ncbi:MAG: P-II family nitrogen regulator [Desulfobulbia bacterium]
MKQIIAYIRPVVLERVTEALRLIDGLTGMSVMEVKGFGQGKGVSFRDQGGTEINYFSEKARIELMVSDGNVGEVVDTIQQKAWTGEKGEGKIYVLNVEEAVRIRTNERGETAV